MDKTIGHYSPQSTRNEEYIYLPRQMKPLLYLFWLLTAIPVLAQPADSLAPAKRPTRLITTDSLIARRRFLTTSIYKNNEKLANASVVSLLVTTPKALTKYRWGNILKPVGPVLFVSALAAGYLGIKGETKTAFIRGVSTKTNPYPDDVQVQYTKRSVPIFMAGLGLFVGSLYFIERSNECTNTAIKLYNAKPGPIKGLARLTDLKIGLTSTGNIGVEARF